VQFGNNDVPQWRIIRRTSPGYLFVANKQGATAMNILHIDSSIRGDASVTRPLSALAVDRLLASHPGAHVEHLDLGKDPIDHLTVAEYVDQEKNPSLALKQFKSADIVVIGSPMYNWTISSLLKAWIDRIAVAGHTFAYTSHGPHGLASGKRVIVITGRSGSMLDKLYDGYDHQEPYLRTIFRFLGIDDVTFVHAQGLAVAAKRPSIIAQAEAEIERLIPSPQTVAA
jgi:FMN-dependent NADH-azoreductase